MKTTSRIRSGIIAAVVAVSLLGLFPVALHAQGKKKGKATDAEGASVRREVPDTVKVERDIVYAKYGEREVKLDLYLPKKPISEKIPVIVVIHGGGWRNGDKTRFAAIAARLAEEGFGAACIGYRLIPEVEITACIEDSKAAVRWVRANAGKYGLDGDHIGAIGGSAGAHLVAMLGTSFKEPKLEGSGGNPGVSSRVQAVVAMAAPTEMSKFGEKSNVSKETIQLISPVTYVDKDSAPLLLLHSEKDAAVPIAQSELISQKYQAAKVLAELVKMGDGHGFWNKPAYFDETMTRTAKFFRAQLGGPKESPKSASGE